MRFKLLWSFGVTHLTVFQEDGIVKLTDSTPPDLSATCSMQFISHCGLMKANFGISLYNLNEIVL